MTANPAFEHVVLIDDNEAHSFLHRCLLEDSGQAREITEFSYAEKALHFLKSPNRSPVDLVLIDINMPVMDGFEFADNFATLYPELVSATRLVMVSGSLNPDDRDRAEAHPAIHSYLVKPVDLDSLLALA